MSSLVALPLPHLFDAQLFDVLCVLVCLMAWQGLYELVSNPIVSTLMRID